MKVLDFVSDKTLMDNPDMKTVKAPDGSQKSCSQAMMEWYALANPLEELGFEIHGFDPGISFKSKQCKGILAIFTISVSDLEIINKAITR
jgi:hypothetical protein